MYGLSRCLGLQNRTPVGHREPLWSSAQKQSITSPSVNSISVAASIIS